MKTLKRNELVAGMLVVLNNQPDAQVYMIAEINRIQNFVILQWQAGSNFCSSGHDIDSNFRKPTVEQIEASAPVIQSGIAWA